MAFNQNISPTQGDVQGDKPINVTVDQSQVTSAVNDLGEPLSSIDGSIGRIVYLDDADFTAGTSSLVAVGGVRTDTPATVTDGDVGPIRIDANRQIMESNSLAIKTAVEILDNVVSGSEAQVDIVASLPAGTNNIGDVDIATIAAGDNNIGNVDIASIAAGNNNIGDVDVASIAAGTNVIGKVYVTDGTNTAAVDAANTARTTATKVLTVQDVDPNGRPAERDSVENATVTIDVGHHKIHEGTGFFCSDIDADIDTAAAKYWRFTTPDTTARIHFRVSVVCAAAATVYLYENPTLDAAGTGLTEFNCDRNSATAAAMTTFYDTTTSNDGTLLKAILVGTNNPAVKFGGNARTEFELILKQNEDYLVKVVTDADNNKATMIAEWYEA